MEEPQPSAAAALFSAKLSSWGKKLNSALEQGMAKVAAAWPVCSLSSLIRVQVDKLVRHAESLENAGGDARSSAAAPRAPVSRPPPAADRPGAAGAGEDGATAQEERESERMDREEAVRVSAATSGPLHLQSSVHVHDASLRRVHSSRVDVQRVLQVEQMERDVAAAAAQLINSSAQHSNRCVTFLVECSFHQLLAQR